MRSRTLPAAVLIAAVAALAGSAVWAFGRSGNGGWMDGGWMTGGNGAGMMGLAAGSGTPVRDLAGARNQAQRFAGRLGLKTGEVIRFSRNYYAELLTANGSAATEVLVDPDTGSVQIEYGPAMMWNTRYGMMSGFRGGGAFGTTGGAGMMGGMMGGGMMGGSAGLVDGAGMIGAAGTGWAPAGTKAMSAATARTIAERWLGRSAPGLTAATPTRFPGYFTVETLRAGKVAGMLSVNATTGAIWPHWWHGRFVALSE